MTSILGTYANLLISIYARGDNAATGLACNVRFNGDAGANYDFQYLRGIGATPSSGDVTATTQSQVASIPGSTAGANLFSSTHLLIPHYAGSSNNKSFVSICSHKYGGSTGNLELTAFAGNWRSNAAINRITILPAAGNLVAGTRITIHALGA